MDFAVKCIVARLKEIVNSVALFYLTRDGDKIARM